LVDFRWHTASLVAVFLALGIGVLMGGTAVGDGALRARQRAALQGIEAQFAALRRDQAELDRLRRFAREALPWMVSGRLSGATVAVVALGQPSAEPDVRSALSLAGAGSYAIDVPAGLAPATAEGWASYGPGDRAARLRRAADELAQALFAGGDLSPLESNGAVLADGPAEPATAVVLLAGPKASAPSVALVLRALLLDRPEGVRVVGAEQGELPLTALFTGRGLSVVDDVERPSGQAALVLSLAGEKGHFGELPGAAGLLPAYGR
jgi:hypothetical protein